MGVIRRMYQYRFPENLTPDLTLEQIRGMEGSRVRSVYFQASKDYGIKWQGRRYDRSSWGKSDPINRALSAAHALLNGLCHTAIVSGGYCPALGFIHNGKQLSFVYDVADLYKAEITIPLAFRITAESTEKLEARVRAACREKFRESKLLERILPDIDHLLQIPKEILEQGEEFDNDQALPSPLWNEVDEESDEVEV
jgi:CRISPR-associated protein Cas1